MKHALTISQQVLGEEHPTTLTIKDNYEKLLQRGTGRDSSECSPS